MALALQDNMAELAILKGSLHAVDHVLTAGDAQGLWLS
jgi:hypothetical protein